jgi:hypothetical protein
MADVQSTSASLPQPVDTHSDSNGSRLHPHDIDTVAAQLGPLGAAVTATRCASAGLAGTITLARSAHPSLRAAVTRFAAGCPTHHSRICGHPHRHGGHNCPWYSNGQRGVRWPFDPWPGRRGSS